MQQALTELEALLRAYGHAYHANIAAIARRLYAQDPKAACQVVNSDEWWNDRDAIAAVDLAIDGGFDAAARADAQRFRSALVTICTTMRAYNEHNAAAELIATQFQKWRESHA